MSGVEAAWVIAAMTAATAVAEGVSARQTAKAEKKAYDENAEVLKRNAAQKRLENSINEDLQRSENRRRISKARAAMGEAGMLDSATALGALGQMSADAEQSALNFRFSSDSEAQNYMSQAGIQDYYGKVAQQKGRNAFNMGLINAGISGASSYGKAKKEFGNATLGDLFGGGSSPVEAGGTSSFSYTRF